MKTYRIELLIFVLGIYILNVSNDVILQEQSQCFVLTSKQLKEEGHQILGRQEVFVSKQN